MQYLVVSASFPSDSGNFILGQETKHFQSDAIWKNGITCPKLLPLVSTLANGKKKGWGGEILKSLFHEWLQE